MLPFLVAFFWTLFPRLRLPWQSRWRSLDFISVKWSSCTLADVKFEDALRVSMVEAEKAW
jgi:hypothetical protein